MDGNGYLRPNAIELCKLSDGDYSNIFDNVKFNLTKTAKSSKSPRFVLLLGQPGAGKSSGAKNIYKNFGDTGGVQVNFDELMTYHPDYYRFTEKNIPIAYGIKGMQEIRNFATKMRGDLIKYSRENGYNIIFENGFTKEAAEKTIPELLESNGIDTIEVVIVKTSNKLSHLSNYIRYQMQLHAFSEDKNSYMVNHYDGPRRLSDKNSTARYVEFRESIDKICNNVFMGKIKNIQIIDRNGVDLFFSKNTKKESYEKIFTSFDKEPTYREFLDSFDRLAAFLPKAK